MLKNHAVFVFQMNIAYILWIEITAQSSIPIFIHNATKGAMRQTRMMAHKTT